MKKIMRNRFSKFILTLVCLVSTNASYADSVTWVGVDAFNWTYNPDEVDKVSATTANLRAGIQYSDNFGVEAHIAAGGSDTIMVEGAEVKADLDFMWGVFVRGIYPISSARLYGVFGLSNLMMTIDSDAVSGADRVTRLSYGAGAEYVFNDNWAINADYIVYLQSDTFTFSGVNAGIKYLFK